MHKIANMSKKIHFIGCQGVSMKMLKSICEHNGFITSGSDLTLKGHDAANVEGVDLVVYSAAISSDNPEIVRAKELGIPIISRSELLGKICKSYDFSIAIAGTHGKTTTTGMLWETLMPLDPTVHIGGTYRGKIGRIGSRRLFITEACEYQRSFLQLYPDIAVILNSDLDHTDCYKDESDIQESYLQFARQAKKLAIISGDEITQLDIKNFKSVGLSKTNDYYPTCISADKNGRYSFCVHHRRGRLGRITLSVAGRHNMINALFVVAICRSLGMPFGRIAAGLSRFLGTERRMELLGYCEGTAIFSDYAHHPREIATSLLSARESCYEHITVVFEPHTYSRTQSFFTGFIDTLSKADRVILLPIFAAREQPIPDISSEKIAQQLKDRQREAYYFSDYQQAKEFLKTTLKDDGIILFMGAGTIDNLAREFAKEYQNSFGGELLR